jgi:nitronate monooxygenase
MISHSSPRVLQGGMGVGVSGWRLARAVAMSGGLGVVSGTALAILLARRLQDGDPDGLLRRALGHFPDARVAASILDAYFLRSGRTPGRSYRSVPMFGLPVARELLQLTVTASFVEVFLAKEGHGGAVGINLLEKIQLPSMAALYGAMLAGADYVLMGAGVPWQIPGILEQLSKHRTATMTLNVRGDAPSDPTTLDFDPRAVVAVPPTPLPRPRFLAVIASKTLAVALHKKAKGGIDGFVVENEQAGGHNAPPRSASGLSATGEPVYGDKDITDLDGILALGLPVWLAGGYGHPEKLQEALQAGAAGIQVGTLFALCAESGYTTALRRALLEKIADDTIQVFTDPEASPTSFPFKVVSLAGSVSESQVYERRSRRCDVGGLRQPFRQADGKLVFRCPAEPLDAFLRKGGPEAEARGKKCLCNALIANIGLAQVRPDGYLEPPLVTAGKDLSGVRRLLRRGSLHYSAADVMSFLLGTEKQCAV